MVTCSKPPSSSVVSMALFMAMTLRRCPVSRASSLTRLVFPLAVGPTSIVIQPISTHFIRDSRGRRAWCVMDSGGSKATGAPPLRCRTEKPTYKE